MSQQLKLTRRHKVFLTGMATGNQRDAPEVQKQLEAAGYILNGQLTPAGTTCAERLLRSAPRNEEQDD